MSAVLRREIDAYQRALEAYRRRYGSAVREQNAALQNLQQGQRYLVPSNEEGVYLVANKIDDKGNFSFDTQKTGGFLGIGRKTVPVTTRDTSLHPVLPEGPTEERMGSAPTAPSASMAQARASNRPSLAQLEGGLIGEVVRGGGVRYSDNWRAPESLAARMAKLAEEEKQRQEEAAEEAARQEPEVRETP